MKCAHEGCPVPVTDDKQFCSIHRPVEEREHRKPTPPAAAGAAQKAQDPAPNPSAQILCPHCQVRGRVTRHEVKAKRGVSGGKVTGAVLTGGISMLGTGLSRKQKVTEMHCGNCETTWHVE